MRAQRIQFESPDMRLIGDRWAAAADVVGDALLLHGGGQTRHAWRDTARILAQHGWNTIAYDARGHGESAWHPDGDYGQDAQVDDLFRVLEHTASPPVLVGASMGGMTSLVAAGEHPERFRALLLVDVALRVDTEESRKVQAFMRAHPDGFADLHAVADAVQAYHPLRKRSPSPEGLKRNVVQRDDGRWYWRWDPRVLDQGRSIEGLSARLREAARRVTVPTLLVRGVQSQMVPEDVLAEFLECVPHAKVQDIAGASHMVAGDNNNSFTRAVTAFLDEVAGAST